MSKAQREKGLRRERQLVEMHRVLGVRAERVPLSGAQQFRDTRGADMDVYVMGSDEAPWVGEVKARASGEGFATIKRWLSDADFLALMEDREQPLIVLPWSRWMSLLLAIKRPVPLTPAIQAAIEEAKGAVGDD